MELLIGIFAGLVISIIVRKSINAFYKNKYGDNDK
jgi:NhaP-type Na+/H+ or K+/H+ antiporter